MSFAEQIETNFDNLLSINTMINNINTKSAGYTETIYLTMFIDKICDISCCPFISISQKNIWLIIEADFTIESEDILLYRQNIISYDSINITDIIMAMIKVNKIINRLKFNKVSGKFIDRIVKNENLFSSYFKTNKNIKFTIDNCCVCLESTKTKTLCGHYICIPCWTKIPKSKCPICRQSTNGEEEDE